MQQFDLQFWTKQIEDQYRYIQKLLDEKDIMNPDRFNLIWVSASGQLEYFINKATELGYYE